MEIKDGNGDYVLSQAVYNSLHDYYIVFFEYVLEPLSFSTFFVIEHEEGCDKCAVISTPADGPIQNAFLTITLDKKQGLIDSIEYEDKYIDISQDF